MEHDIKNRKVTCQSTGTPLHAFQNLVNFGPETAESGWRVFCPPPKFLHWETLPTTCVPITADHLLHR